MKTKLLEAVKAKCKPFGLTKKALEELVEIGASDLTDDASDDDIAAKADSLVPYAKAMQGEITRKTKKPSAKPSAKSSDDEDDGEGDGEGDGKEAPAWAKKMTERLDALEEENTKLKAEKAANERAAQIASVAKKHGIPDFMVKHLHFADDADIEAEMSNFKQELVNNSLAPKSLTHETGNDLAAAKEDAKAWAASLPDNKLA